ncbi:MAG TPA: DUF1549 domain-containing protein, partial [Pirellulaceae bacterium]|nr:DUF1549 domain-containing protein [Pirellulaceae bacterium]
MSWPTIALLVQVTLGPLEYNRDVRPILSDKCFRCHGPDAQSRRAELRLDQRESAVAPRDGRAAAVVPGKPDASELIARITSPDAERRMPPPEAGPPLTPPEIAALRQWIADGAEYQPHWSLVAPRRSPPPTTRRRDWSLGPLDPFVLKELERRELAPSPPADVATLLRRASLDLIGLPPSLEELDEASRSVGEKRSESEPDWYERAVDRLLASPRYGERMAVDWLDAARYADTNGMFSDTERRAWPWRDWVLRAFNRNQPFDEFTIEQLAGDLLPSPTLDQRIATGFNRQHTVTNETGIIDEEYRVEYMADRLETTATVWLGLTLGCARCHDHKYDPLTQRDYYR